MGGSKQKVEKNNPMHSSRAIDNKEDF